MHSARSSPRSDGVANSPYTIVCVGTDVTSIGQNALRSRSDSLPPTRTSYRVWTTALASSGTWTLTADGDAAPQAPSRHRPYRMNRPPATVPPNTPDSTPLAGRLWELRAAQLSFTLSGARTRHGI